MSNPHTVILGAGLMGRLMAHALLQRGHRIELYEAQGPEAHGAAAHVAAAMLAPLAESAITELNVVKMGQHSLQRWPELIQTLNDPVFFQQEGSLIVWHRADAPEASRFQALVERTQRQCPSLPEPKTLSPSQLQALEPELSHKFHQGLYLPREGQLDNRQLLAALLRALQAAEKAGQLRIHWHRPQALAEFEDPHRSHAQRPSWVIDCTGMGAKAHWPQVRGVRGEVIRVHAPDVHLTRPIRLIHPRYPIYIAPKPNRVYVIGATEVESEDRSEVSVRSALELMSAIYSVHPGFAEARLLEISTQLRPTLNDNLPEIQLPAPNLIKINGLYRHGFLIAPSVMDCALEWIDHQRLDLARTLGLSVKQTGSANDSAFP